MHTPPPPLIAPLAKGHRAGPTAFGGHTGGRNDVQHREGECEMQEANPL